MSLEQESVLPEICFTKVAAANYEKNKRMKFIQKKMTQRALELLNLEKGIILDVGCGTGFSMQEIQDSGFKVKGIDISQPMLDIAKKKGLMVKKADFRKIPYKDNGFDAIISISALQWVHGKSYNEIVDYYSDTASEFKRVLKKKGKAVIQFYPKTKEEFNLMIKIFRKFFKIIIAEDFPDIPKKRKRYIILQSK